MLCLPLALLLPIVICFTVGRKYKKDKKKSDNVSPGKVAAETQNAYSMTIHAFLSMDAIFHRKKQAGE